MGPNARAIGMMLVAIFFFTTMDATAKAVAERSNTYMALWARYAGQAVLVLVLIAPRLRATMRTNFPVLQAARSVVLLGATAFFFFGIAHIGLAEATAIMDVNPVLITLGAALFLGEAIGIRRILAIGVALIGALIVIRPGTDVFSLAALLPVGAACCYATYAIITRYIGNRESPWTSLFYGAVLGALAMSVLVPFHWQTPDLLTALMMLLLAGAGTLGQLFLIRAFSSGEAAMLAPFAYVGLVFATFWGIVLFQEYPDRWTVLGALIIVGSGVYVWHREVRAARAPDTARAKLPPEGV
ncbi:DMT family transporter [Pseudooceanicola aestuarii]|uniref:DMT family transporter n=1 Tax=Pseudooceanicola aestuarii TaxID=2697319 RepID=UPI0013D1CA3F|nr:DMT family transporter [Pseudooceanicola aestuarii]